MGLRTAAAKLGFRLAATTSNKNITSSHFSLLFTRRSISSVAATADGVTQKEKSSTLFLCFDERTKLGYERITNLVVRPVQLDGNYADYRDKDEELRKEAAHKSFDFDDIVTAPGCLRLGSEILFGSGYKNPIDICWVDPSTRPVDFHVSSPTETKIKSFATGKSRMEWGVIDGKIYCFDNYCRSVSDSDDDSEVYSDEEEFYFPKPDQAFEVLDPENDDTKWQPLSGPPFIREDGGTDKYSVLFLNGSKKILGWEEDKNGVFCFDTTKPENGWERSPPSLQNLIPFSRLHCMTREDNLSVSVSSPVIHDNHPKLGDFNLVFAHNLYDEPFLISPFYISNNCDSFQSVSGTIRLPKETCSKYILDYLDGKNTCNYDGKPNIMFDSKFVDLGAKRFCLILHKFSEKDSEDDKTKGIILVLTFEYEVMVNDEIKLKTRLCETRRFKYHLAKTLENNMPRTTSRLIGAYSF